MKHLKNYIVLLVLFVMSLWAGMGGYAQNTAYPVNLEAVLKLTRANNLTIEEYQLKYQLSLADHIKTKEWWLPSLYFGATTHYLIGAAMNADGNIFSPVNRNNLWTGLGISLDLDFSKGIYGTLAAKQKTDAFKYFVQAERNFQIINAIDAYYKLQVEQLKFSAIQELVAQADTLMQQIQIQVDVGLRYQSEYLLAKTNLNRYKIMMWRAKTDWELRSAELTNLLNLQQSVILTSSDSLLLPINFYTDFSDTTLFTNFYQKRPEYMYHQSTLLSLQTQRKNATRGAFIPKLRITADDGLFGRFQSPFSNTFQLNAGLVWQLPFGRLSYNGDVKQYNTQILIQQNQIDQFQNNAQPELTQNISQLKTVKEQMLLARESLDLSIEALNQSVQRQRLGTAMPFEVFQAQEFYMQAQMDYLESVSKYNILQYQLYVTTGNNL